ncbi:MAG: 2,3-diaminopropionate biosynthesis protein SbnB [Candidatus Peregrinibacteria bacterium]
MEESPSKTLWLSDEQVQDLLTPDEAYAAVANALACHARGDFQQPLKPYIRPKGREQERTGGRFIAMPAYLGGDLQAAGLKWIAGFPANIEKGLPRASGLMALNSTETGRLLALMPCETLSARRTAAIAALSFDHLAPPPPRKVAVIGAGPIGRSVLEALVSHPERGIVEARLCDLRRQRAEEAVHLLSGISLPPVRIFTDAQSCVQDAEVVVTATTGSRDYLQNEWLSRGRLLVALSLDDCKPEVLLSSDKVVVDDFDQCCREEKLLHRLVQERRFSRERIAATLGEIINGTKTGRTQASENIYVNPMGMAIEDVAVAQTVFRKALREHIGIFLP